MKSKTSAQHGAAFAKGGNTAMHRQQAAGPAKSGHSGKVEGVVPGAKSAKGGAKTSGHSLAVPAKGGRTGSSNVKGR